MNRLENRHRFKVLDIIRGTTVDGPGFRTSIYLAGCNHHCPGCHNPESWDFKAGREMSLAELMDIIEEEDFDVTLSGGDPLYHPREIEVLIREIVKTGHTVWLFTGFTWEEILRDENKFRCVSAAEAVVDGPFIKELRDADLQFRGSSNQRIINVRESLDQGNTVLF